MPSSRPNERRWKGPPSAPARGERWLSRAERVSDAFGLVFVLVLTTYVLTSLLANHGWAAVLLTIATSATSIVALTSSHAHAAVGAAGDLALGADDPPRRGRRRLATSAPGSTSPRWSRSPCWRSRWGRCCAGSSPPPRSARARSSARSASTPCSASSSPTSTGRSTGSRAAPFFEGVAHPDGSDFLFFSYTTLTTTGYGNLVPAASPAG